MPCPAIGPKRFQTHPDQFRQAQNWLYSTKCFETVQTIWTSPKLIWAYFGPMEGQGIVFKDRLLELFKKHLNPKRCGLFGQLRMRGVSKSDRWEIAVSGCFNFHPSSTNSTLNKSWHLHVKFETSVRSLKSKVWPQEISEVTEVKMKKILCENPKITNFCLTEM